MTDLDRRTFILGATGLTGAAALLAACSDDNSVTATGSAPDTAPDAPPNDDPVPDVPAELFLVATFPDGYRGPSPFVHSVEQRVAYALHDGVDIMRDSAPERVQLEIFFGDELVAGGDVARRNQGVPTPYYSVLFTPAAAGDYTAVLTTGDESSSHTFLVLEPGETEIPQPGDKLPGVDTATFDDARGVDPICTRLEPCPFHETNLADAIAAADKPTVLSIATPGFCQTAICGPVIELLIDATADRDDIHVIHAEVYVDPNNEDGGTQTGNAETTEIVDAFVLPYEPVLFIADADGTILRRLDAVYDGSELEEALALV